jgi:MYXO-CTERM domain-containing protein
MVRLRLLRALLAAPISLAAVVFAPRALADVLPPTACDSNAKEGQSCTTAGSGGDEDGVCETETCSSINHLPDGGFGPPNSYPCLLCVVVDAGPAPADAAPPSTDAAPPVTDAEPPSPDAAPANTEGGADPCVCPPDGARLASTSNCAVAFVGAGPQGASWFFGLGAVGLVVAGLSRRRREH